MRPSRSSITRRRILSTISLSWVATTTVVVATHDREMVDKMRRRVVELREGRIVRDELSGLYRPDESTTEFAVRLRGEMGVGPEGHPN